MSGYDYPIRIVTAKVNKLLPPLYLRNICWKNKEILQLFWHKKARARPSSCDVILVELKLRELEMTDVNRGSS